MDDREDFSNRNAVHDAMEHFTYHWAPSQPRKAAEFHADLLRLIQAVHRDSAKPMEIALKNAFAFMPILPSMFPPAPSCDPKFGVDSAPAGQVETVKP
jgi:hypothetical protein